MKPTKFRCTTRCGLSVQWTVAQVKDGRWKAVSVGGAKRGGRSVPPDFLPFDVMNAVINGPRFDTEAEAVAFVRGL